VVLSLATKHSTLPAPCKPSTISRRYGRSCASLAHLAC